MSRFSLLRHVSASALTYPASVNAPVNGSSLTTVYDRMDGRPGQVGTSGVFANGSWPGGLSKPDPLPAYLSPYVTWSNDGSRLVLYVGGGNPNLTLSDYDFRANGGAPPIDPYDYLSTGGVATLRNCRLPGLNFPGDLNGGLRNNANYGFVLHVEDCEFDNRTFSIGCEELIFLRCRFKNQTNNLGNVEFTGTVTAKLTYDSCYITGGGIAPPAGTHVELTQANRNQTTPASEFTVIRTFVNLGLDGQATNLPWGDHWTSIWASQSNNTTYKDSIFIGAPLVNSNPLNPDVVNAVFGYSTGNITIDNVVLETGIYGYASPGVTAAPTVTGARDLNNTAIPYSAFIV